MDRILILEKEVDDLRRKLREKEDELTLLRRSYNSSTDQNGDDCNGAEGSVKYGTLPKWAIERYSRQILLREIGVPGQAKICSARVLIVGAGGLGCPAAMYLAGAGVGEIGIVDYDTVEITNIHRQLLHKECNTDMNKAESAAESIRSINSRIKVTPYKLQLDSSNAMSLAVNYDVILDCTDNAPTRYLLSDLCVLAKLPLISGSALKLEGQLTVYCYRSDKHNKEIYKGPCYRCVFPTPPSPDAMGSCSQHGVAGPVPGAIGTLQAMEALKYIIGHPSKSLLVERMLIMDVDDMSCKVVQLRPRNINCAICSDTPSITKLIDYEVFCNTIAKEKKSSDSTQKQRRRAEKEKRQSGQSYYGFRTITLGDKKIYTQDVLKCERRLGPRCTSDICVRNPERYCQKLTDSDRQSIFDNFWRLEWSEKKNFVRSLVETVTPKKRRLIHKGNVSRKVDSKCYYLILNDVRLSVCRITFLNTLGIKEAMVRCWLTKDKTSRSKHLSMKTLNVISYIETLPITTAKCQYCLRNDISTKYIDLNIKKQSDLYNLYVSNMRSVGSIPVSRKTFLRELFKRNIRIFKPKNKNDVCDLVNEHNMNVVNIDKLDSYYFSNIEQW